MYKKLTLQRPFGRIITDEQRQPTFKLPVIRPIKQLIELQEEKEKPKINFYQKNQLKM